MCLVVGKIASAPVPVVCLICTMKSELNSNLNLYHLWVSWGRHPLVYSGGHRHPLLKCFEWEKWVCLPLSILNGLRTQWRGIQQTMKFYDDFHWNKLSQTGRSSGWWIIFNCRRSSLKPLRISGGDDTFLNPKEQPPSWSMWCPNITRPHSGRPGRILASDVSSFSLISSAS